VVRRTALSWVVPSPFALRLLRARSVVVNAEGRAHALSESMVTATRTLLESVKAAIPAGAYSPRAMLYLATFATFGTPADSTMAEDVGTATEPLMIPDAATTPPTRVATLTMVGRGTDAMPLLVQDDGTGAAPIFGIGESVTILLPAARGGRRGAVTGKILARQRVEAMREACQAMKIWTYLVALPPADLLTAQRGPLPSPRPAEGIDRWNGTAVREPVAARMTPAELRGITASRATVAQFVRERASTGIRDRDVQMLAVLPKSAGYVTNFGAIMRDGAGGWRFPRFALRPATCQ
jgi:hypothetical protein